MTDQASLLDQLAPEAKKLLKGRNLDDDKLRQLVEIDPLEQAQTLRRFHMGLEWEKALPLPKDPPTEEESTASDDHDTPEAALAELHDSDPDHCPQPLLQEWRLDALRPNKWNAQLFPDSLTDESIEPLAESLDEHGQIYPIIATPDGEMIDGERRFRGLKRLGRDTALVQVTGPMTDGDILDAVLRHATLARQLSLREQVLVYRTVLEQVRRNSGRRRGQRSRNSSPNGDELTPQQMRELAATRSKFTSARQAERADAVFARAPAELLEKVMQGEVSLTAAYEQLPKQARAKPGTRSSQVESVEPPTESESTTSDLGVAPVVCGDPFVPEELPAVEPAKSAPVQTAPEPQLASVAVQRAPEPRPALVPPAAANTALGSKVVPATLPQAEFQHEEEDEPETEPDDHLDALCEHLERLRAGDENDEASDLERYEAANAELERLVERLTAAVGEPSEPDEEMVEEEEERFF